MDDARPSGDSRYVRSLSDTDPISMALIVAGVVAAAIAICFKGGSFSRAASDTARPFLEVFGIVFLGWMAVRSGLTARIVIPRSWHPRAKVAMILGLTAALAGLTNLDVSVVVMMPVALTLAAQADLDAGLIAIAVANAANATSFLLPTSNLTNLLVMGTRTIPPVHYVAAVWPAWLGVSAVTVGLLACVSARRVPTGVARSRPDTSWSLPRIVLDLLAMFLLAAGLRTLLVSGFTLPGGFAAQTTGGSLIASVADNLPAASVVRSGAGLGPWTAILSMSVGANLLLTGSVATVLCRRLAKEGGATFSLRRSTFAGATLLPIQMSVAYLGLRLSGAVR